jgi:penicillin-binding protein 1A
MIRLFASFFSNIATAMLFAIGGLAALVQIFGEGLPSYDELRSYQPKMLTRVYSGGGEIIAEFARERRVFVPIDEVPEVVKAAFISAEDKNFYTHPGVDGVAIAKAIGRFGMARAAGQNAQLAGASGITQQVVKNFLVGDERSVERKVREAILAVRVDGALSKDQILELYLNDIYLGARAYGIVAAAQNYFGKTLEELEAQEAAYLAALPKAPSALHPIQNHDAAVARRNYVLREMWQNGFLDRDAYREVVEAPLDTILDERTPTVLGDADPSYFTDEVRRQLIREVGVDQLYRGGLTVRATIDDELQQLAQRVLRDGLEKYDRRRGQYGGPIAKIPQVAESGAENWRALLARTNAPRDIDGWHLGVVLEVGDSTALVGVEGVDDAAEGQEPGVVRLRLDREREWIRRSHLSQRSAPGSAGELWEKGDVVFVEREDEGWAMRQIPQVQGAFMAMDPHSGRVLALVGGFSFDHSVFNRATQAQRQPGSAFKPFVYAAALDAGYKPTTIVLDAPIAIDDGRKTWRPKNSSGKFYGPTPLRKGLEMSRNLMTVRIAQAVGMDRVAMYAERFGIYDDMPGHLAYALGAGETTLYQMVAAYSMFANGGKRVQPTLIDRIQNRYGETLYSHDPRICQGCDVQSFGRERTPILFDQRSQIMDPVTAWRLVDMLRGVVDHGTANRTVGGLPFPVAGKTGTTNDAKDAWFIGFTENLVAGCFIGFDNPTPMGDDAYGGTLCGPVFREFMKEAMETRTPGSFEPPRGGGVVTIKVHRETGERLPDDAEGPDVVVRTYDLGPEPEILVDDVLALADDAALFGGYGADLPYLLPEGEDVPLGAGGGAGSAGGGVSRPANVGLGTGGLY